MNDITLKAAIEIQFDKYTSVGSYPLFYIKKLGFMEGSCICPDCLNDEDERDYIEVSSKEEVGTGINYEDQNLFCDHCSEKIESAY